MKTIKLILVALSIVSVSMAQTINISGIVKDSAGVGIEGATVKLENAAITTTTSNDGNFTLTNNPTTIRQQNPTQFLQQTILAVRNGRLHFSLHEQSVVKVDVYDLEGSMISNIQKTIAAGSHSLSLPVIGKGINIYKVRIGQIEHIFKGAFSGYTSCCSMELHGTTGVLSKQTQKAVRANTIEYIAVTKSGYRGYRAKIDNLDTSGIVVTLLLQDTSQYAGTVTDIDDNVYQTIKIGNQVWTVENLRTTRYNDGTPIPHVTGNSEWENLNTPGYSYYDNDSISNAEKYGALYNWYAVDTKKLAPPGWHVPTDAEWTELEDYLIANGYNWDGTTSGNKIAKSLASQTDWSSSSYEGNIGNDLSKNNASGFSALPGGARDSSGNFYDIGFNGYWWSATEDDADNAWYRNLYYDYDRLDRDNGNKGAGLSVRLLRD